MDDAAMRHQRKTSAQDTWRVCGLVHRLTADFVFVTLAIIRWPCRGLCACAGMMGAQPALRTVCLCGSGCLC